MSIHTKSLLVSLNVGMMPQTKKVRPVSEELEFKHHTAPKQSAVISKLFAKEDVKGLQQSAGEARRRFKELTLPFGRGTGIIAAAKYFDFLEEFRQLKGAFDSERQHIIDNIRKVLANAEEANGTLFDADNYPSLDELAESMYFSIEVTTVPAENAFDQLAGLSPEEVQKLKDEAVLSNSSKIESAMRDLFTRMFKSLHHAAERLDDEGGGLKIFRNTLLENIEKSIEAAETLNINDDAQLKTLVAEAKQILSGISADDLRKDKDLRAETAAKAKDLATKMSEFF